MQFQVCHAWIAAEQIIFHLVRFPRQQDEQPLPWPLSDLIWRLALASRSPKRTLRVFLILALRFRDEPFE